MDWTTANDPRYSEAEYVEEMIKCCLDGDYYPASEMVYDQDGGNFIHKSNIEKYLIPYKRDMSEWDYNALKLNLYKQIV